jgi:hypothetical protein
MAQFDELMNDPQTRSILSGLQGGQRTGGTFEGMKAPSNPLSNLADAYPKMKEQAEKMKIEEAERKAKKLKFDFILAKAEQQFNMRQQQQQIQAAQNSV